jgi:hypothetical protein
MQRILAVAVGLGSDTNAPVVLRDIIANKRMKDTRPYVAGLISGLEKLGLRGGEDYEIDYATGGHKDLTKLLKAAIGEKKPDAMFAMSTSAVKAAMSPIRCTTAWRSRARFPQRTRRGSDRCGVIRRMNASSSSR